MACFIEQNYDEKGIVWKRPLAPFDIHLIAVNQQKFPEVKNKSDELYSELSKAGYEVLYDDREETPGVKFNDADLIGLPVQLIIGPKNLENNKVEIKIRATGERKLVEIETLKEELESLFE